LETFFRKATALHQERLETQAKEAPQPPQPPHPTQPYGLTIIMVQDKNRDRSRVLRVRDTKNIWNRCNFYQICVVMYSKLFPCFSHINPNAFQMHPNACLVRLFNPKMVPSQIPTPLSVPSILLLKACGWPGGTPETFIPSAW